MKKLVYLYIILFSLIPFSSCNSLDSDAEKAAKLNIESMEYTKKADLQRAEELYNESQRIIALYKDTDKFKEFYTAYNSYMASNTTKE